MKRIAAMLMVLAASPAALGAELTYTFSGTASGKVGGVSFRDATLTVTTSGDTSAITNLSVGTYVFPSAAGMTTFTIGGLGSGTFSNPTYVFDNQTVFGGAVGFGDGSDDIQIHDADIGSTAYSTYNLGSAIGPLTPVTDPSTPDWTNLLTSLGGFTVSSYTGVTFEASVPSVPEPATLALLGLGLAALGIARRSRAN